MPLMPAGSLGRAHDDKVIVHEVNALRSESLGNKLLLERFRMDHNKIDGAPLRDVEGSPGTRTHVADPDARLLFKPIFENINDPRIDGTYRTAQKNKLLAFRAAQAGQKTDKRKQPKSEPVSHTYLLRFVYGSVGAHCKQDDGISIQWLARKFKIITSI